jgi:D-alanine-D-alanine ligase-like ATP-grasp enzyme
MKNPYKQGIPPLAVPFLQKAAAKIGAIILIEPEWGLVGQITYKTGIKRYIRLTTLDLNTMGAAAIACDKDYTKFFLQSMGYPVPVGQTFFRKDFAQLLGIAERGLDDSYSYARSIGLPVFVKPNTLSCGVGVSKAYTRTEFYKAARAALRQDRVILVEKAVCSKDYRIVVMDGQIICAYERIPLHIVGDGHSSISKLLDKKQSELSARGRKTTIDRNDFRLLANLKHSHYDFDTVLPKDHKVQLLDNANLTSGGDLVDVTADIHPDFRKLAINITRDMGLRLAGVDLIVDGLISQPVQATNYWIIEINAAPGFDHFISLGQKQEKLIEDLYLNVLRSMERAQEMVTAPLS